MSIFFEVVVEARLENVRGDIVLAKEKSLFSEENVEDVMMNCRFYIDELALV